MLRASYLDLLEVLAGADPSPLTQPAGHGPRMTTVGSNDRTAVTAASQPAQDASAGSAVAENSGDLVLLSQHEHLLRDSAITDEVARARGYRSVALKAELGRLDFGRAQRQVPGLLIPVHSVFGEVPHHQYRPDTPREKRGRPVKYETPFKTRMVLDVHPANREGLGDPAIPLWITEGIRKGDAATTAGLCAIALQGVWNWRGSNDKGGKTALADWEMVALKGRESTSRLTRTS